MLKVRYHAGDSRHPFNRVVYMLLTDEVFYLTQYEQSLGKNRKWVLTYSWEVPAMGWEVDEPCVYDFVRNPIF